MDPTLSVLRSTQFARLNSHKEKNYFDAHTNSMFVCTFIDICFYLVYN